MASRAAPDGNFTVTRGDDVAAFLAARAPEHETLVFVDTAFTARELYNRLRQGHEAQLRSDLDAPFVVAHLPRHEPPPPPRKRRRRPMT